MSQTTDTPLGRTLRSTTGSFTFGCMQNTAAIPEFGAVVRVESGRVMVYGLVYEAIIQDDPFVRQVVAASPDLAPERVEDMRQRRQAPVEVTALAVAYRQDGNVYQRLPPRPPDALEPIYGCAADEVREVLKQSDYFRTVLNSPQCPVEELLAASLRVAAACQPPDQGQPFLVEAGRELARLLAADPARLDAILRRLLT